MTGQISIFKDVEGRDLLVNLTDDFQFLRTPSMGELRRLLKEFRKRQLEWARRTLLQRPEDNGRFITGLSASLVPAPKGSRVKDKDWRALNTVVISVDAVPDAAWKVVEDVPPLRSSSPSTCLANATTNRSGFCVLPWVTASRRWTISCDRHIDWSSLTPGSRRRLNDLPIPCPSCGK
jgi:hypothetical protein